MDAEEMDGYATGPQNAPPAGPQANEISEVLGGAGRAYVKMLLPMLPLVALFAAPAAIIGQLIPFDQLADYLRLSEKTALKFEMQVTGIVNGLSLVLPMFATVVLTPRALAGRPLDCWSALGRAVRRFFPSLWTGLVAGLAFVGVICVGLLPFIAYLAASKSGTPGGPVASAFLALFAVAVLVAAITVAIWLAIRWSLASQSAILGGLCGPSALRESVALVKGRFWATLGILLVSAFAGWALSIPSVIVQAIAGGIEIMTHGLGPVAGAVFGFVATLLSALASMFQTVVITALYVFRRGAAEEA